MWEKQRVTGAPKRLGETGTGAPVWFLRRDGARGDRARQKGKPRNDGPNTPALPLSLAFVPGPCPSSWTLLGRGRLPQP